VRQLYAWPRIGQCVHGVVKELITAPRAQANQTATLCSGLARQAEQVR
jgi:hypothetical protein